MLIKIIDAETKFVIDITVHNLLPILNTNLLCLYSLLDQRFHILGIYLKYWSKINKIHGAADNYLSSYAILLMLIHFLQKIVEPKVLPNLQKLENKIKNYEYNNGGKTIRTNIYFEKDLLKIKKEMEKDCTNKDSATILLIKFFEYYSYYFDYHNQKISIHKELIDTVKTNIDNVAFSIDDPFDETHDPGRSMNINSVQFNKFLTAMKKEINYILNGEYNKRLDLISKK
jgi:DNA polymerase sigma